MLALSSGNVRKYEFLTGNNVLPGTDLLEKAVTMKRFEYLTSGKELEAQTNIAKKQYQNLSFSTLENYSKSNLMYNTDHSFDKYYCDSKKFNNLSYKSKYSFLAKFF